MSRISVAVGLRPEPLLTELLIHPLPVIRFQWWLRVSLMVDSAATVGAAVVGLIEGLGASVGEFGWLHCRRCW